MVSQPPSLAASLPPPATCTSAKTAFVRCKSGLSLFSQLPVGHIQAPGEAPQVPTGPGPWPCLLPPVVYSAPGIFAAATPNCPRITLYLLFTDFRGSGSSLIASGGKGFVLSNNPRTILSGQAEDRRAPSVLGSPGNGEAVGAGTHPLSPAPPTVTQSSELWPTPSSRWW